MISIAEYFEKENSHNHKKMNEILNNSDVPYDTIMGYKTYTFSDGSTIYFNPQGYCISK